MGGDAWRQQVDRDWSEEVTFVLVYYGDNGTAQEAWV